MKINKMISNFPSYITDGVYEGHQSPSRITIHNTAGGTSAYQFAKSEQSSSGYSAGIPHYYVDKDEIWQVVPDNVISWANGSFNANEGAITIEVVDGYTNDSDFLKAEQLALDLSYELSKKYNIKPDSNTFRIHKDYIATSCPARSEKLHNNKAKQFFINEVNKRLDNDDVVVSRDIECIFTQEEYDPTIHGRYYLNGSGDKYGIYYGYSNGYNETDKVIINNSDTVENIDKCMYYVVGFSELKISECQRTLFLYKDVYLVNKVIDDSGSHKHMVKGDKFMHRFVGRMDV